MYYYLRATKSTGGLFLLWLHKLWPTGERVPHNSAKEILEISVTAKKKKKKNANYYPVHFWQPYKPFT